MNHGHVRKEGANEPAGNLHGGKLVTQETETSRKVDAGIGDDRDIGASLRWANTAGADSDGGRGRLHKRYGLSGWSRIQEGKHSPHLYW
jgi:hypothetical protein